MYVDESQITAKVYKELNGMYLVNVGFPDIGFYIGSITVRPSPKYPERGLWVQPPKYQPKPGGKYVSPLEFPKDSAFWPIIEAAARRAVDEYQNPVSTAASGKDILPTVEEVNNFDPDEAFKNLPP
jgi:hypothetical protein